MRRLPTILLAIAKRVGRVQAWLLLSLFYVVILAPVAILFKLCADPLQLRRGRPVWHASATPRDLRRWAQAQF